MRRDVDVSGVDSHSIETTLENAEELHLLEMFALFLSGLNFID